MKKKPSKVKCFSKISEVFSTAKIGPKTKSYTLRFTFQLFISLVTTHMMHDLNLACDCDIWDLEVFRSLQFWSSRYVLKWFAIYILTLMPRLSNTDALKVDVMSKNWFLERSFLRCIDVNSSILILLGSGLGQGHL